MFLRLAATALFLAAPALAHAYGPDYVVRGLCKPDGCQDFAVLEATPIATGEDGTLRQTRIQTIRSTPGGRTNLRVEDGWVYCSRTRPAIIARSQGETRAYLLAPTAAQTTETIRQEASQHAVYFGACHGVEFGNDAAKDPEGVASDLGYEVSLLQPQQVSLAKPDDILSPHEGSQARARRVESARPSRGWDDPSARELDQRLDRFLGQKGRQGISRGEDPSRFATHPLDEPYDGPFVDDAWLPRRR